MSYLLSDEEILECWLGKKGDPQIFNLSESSPFRRVAKAQDAKTKEKLVIAFSENSHMGRKYLNVNPQWWETLKKEVEDGH